MLKDTGLTEDTVRYLTQFLQNRDISSLAVIESAVNRVLNSDYWRERVATRLEITIPQTSKIVDWRALDKQLFDLEKYRNSQNYLILVNYLPTTPIKEWLDAGNWPLDFDSNYVKVTIEARHFGLIPAILERYTDIATALFVHLLTTPCSLNLLAKLSFYIANPDRMLFINLLLVVGSFNLTTSQRIERALLLESLFPKEAPNNRFNYKFALEMMIMFDDMIQLALYLNQIPETRQILSELFSNPEFVVKRLVINYPSCLHRACLKKN